MKFLAKINTNINMPLIIGGIIVGTMAIIALLAPVIAPYNPIEAKMGQALQPPSWEHWFGTDRYGMDILSRILYAPRIDLVIPASGTLLALLIGVPIGAIVGYYSEQRGFWGLFSEFIMRALEILQAFPVFVLALALVAVLGRHEINIVYALVVLGAPMFLRLTRSSVLSVRKRTFVEAAKCAGNSEIRIIFRHVLPNSLGPALINASVFTGVGILVTAGLAFVGAGVPPPTPEWGYMVSVGAENMVTGEWWPSVFPGIFIGITVLGFALLGQGLVDYLDPEKKTI